MIYPDITSGKKNGSKPTSAWSEKWVELHSNLKYPFKYPLQIKACGCFIWKGDGFFHSSPNIYISLYMYIIYIYIYNYIQYIYLYNLTHITHITVYLADQLHFKWFTLRCRTPARRLNPGGAIHLLLEGIGGVASGENHRPKWCRLREKHGKNIVGWTWVIECPHWTSPNH